jgi:hypothetical protein
MAYELMKEEQEGEEVKITMKIPRRLAKQLKVYAGVKDTTVTAVVIQACEKLMDEDRLFREKFKPHIV